MSIFNFSQVQAAVDAAFATAAASPAKVATSPISDNATMRTDVYTAPDGAGFRVVATIDFGSVKKQIVRNSGPDTGSERTLNQVQWNAAATAYKALREAAYPPMENYVDAQAKISSPDAGVQTAGTTELNAYLAACLAVKAKYPKPPQS